MTPAKRKIWPPGKIHGGKAYLARRIIQALGPIPEVYVEGFGGLFSVGANLPQKVKARYYIERNYWTFNLIQWLYYDPERLIRRVRPYVYNEENFKMAKAHKASVIAFRHDNSRKRPYPSDKSLEDAAMELIIRKFSRGGLGRDFAWSDRLRGGQPGDANSWYTSVKPGGRLDAFAKALGGVLLAHGQFLFLWDKMNWKKKRKVLIYLDPPYLHKTRRTVGEYGEGEMSWNQHLILLRKISHSSVRCRIAISSYNSKLYRRFLKGWRCERFKIANHSSQAKKKKRRIECLWCNFDEEGRLL